MAAVHQWMTIVAPGTTYRIPPFVDAPSGDSALGVICGAITDFAPDGTWDDLRARHEQYQLEHPE